MQLNLSAGIKNDEFHMDNTIDVFNNIMFFKKLTSVSGETISTCEWVVGISQL